MGFSDAIRRILSSWMKNEGPHDNIVVCTRVRLARNLAKVPFPHVAKKEELREVLAQAEKLVDALADFGSFRFYKMAEMPALERQLMVEKHLISPRHAEDTSAKGLLLQDSEDVSIMVNEEDHFRLQVLLPGEQLEEGWRLITKLDDAIEKQIHYAFDEELGYLSACPTNVGTGLRASVMLHLPALVKVNQIGKILESIRQFGLAVRGLYGEGTESIGNMYQISNQVTLGHTESETIEHLTKITGQIINSELQARKFLLQEENRFVTEDQVNRSYGILANARLISTKEAMQLLSDVRLGIDLGLIKNIDARLPKELMFLTRSAHLQKIMGQDLPPEERDRLRASLIRDTLQNGLG